MTASLSDWQSLCLTDCLLCVAWVSWPNASDKSLLNNFEDIFKRYPVVVLAFTFFLLLFAPPTLCHVYKYLHSCPGARFIAQSTYLNFFLCNNSIVLAQYLFEAWYQMLYAIIKKNERKQNKCCLIVLSVRPVKVLTDLKLHATD